MVGHKLSPHPHLVETMPQIYMSMGHTAEMVASRYGVSREDQDEFAVSSHQKAAKAIQQGKFKDEIVPFTVVQKGLDDNGKPYSEEVVFDTDEGVRPDSNVETLSKLRPAFGVRGTVTAGNSSQTSDGASAVIVMSKEKAEELELKPLASFRSFAVGGVDPEIMGIGPIVAIPKALKLAGITKEQIDLIELNEAFASQCLQVARHLELDMDRLNVNGGAIALGHPLGCTGAKLTVTLINELKRRGGGKGLVSMCVGGGMGAAGVFEVYA